jgi:hypothetical protein
MASEVRRVAAAATLPHSYVVRGDALEFGASLGNAHCWLTTHGNGSIQDVFSTDLGQAIAHTIAVHYGGSGHHLLRASAQAVTTSPEAADVQLRPGAPGTIELHPAYQRHSFALPENLQVQETVFVPHATGDDPAVAYYQVEVTNASAAAQTVRVYAFGRLGGALGHLEGDFSVRDAVTPVCPHLAGHGVEPGLAPRGQRQVHACLGQR